AGSCHIRRFVDCMLADQRSPLHPGRHERFDAADSLDCDHRRDHDQRAESLPCTDEHFAWRAVLSLATAVSLTMRFSHRRASAVRATALKATVLMKAGTRFSFLAPLQDFGRKRQASDFFNGLINCSPLSSGPTSGC